MENKIDMTISNQSVESQLLEDFVEKSSSNKTFELSISARIGNVKIKFENEDGTDYMVIGLDYNGSLMASVSLSSDDQLWNNMSVNDIAVFHALPIHTQERVMTYLNKVNEVKL